MSFHSPSPTPSTMRPAAHAEQNNWPQRSGRQGHSFCQDALHWRSCVGGSAPGPSLKGQTVGAELALQTLSPHPCGPST